MTYRAVCPSLATFLRAIRFGAAPAPPVRRSKTGENAIPETNTRMIQEMLKRKGPDAANLRWAATLSEVGRGWVTPPIPLADKIANALP